MSNKIFKDVILKQIRNVQVFYAHDEDDLNNDKVAILIQAFTRLQAEGLLSTGYKYDSLMDIVLARGAYENTKTDQATYETLMGLDK